LNSGNVGIKNNNPTVALDVAGAALISTTLGVTGAISIGNTVAAGVAVASTHKVTVVIGGTTYYLLASNV
jgi:mannose/fructose/N-acetylgalactosamine-specific phosphotransferase system component IIC